MKYPVGIQQWSTGHANWNAFVDPSANDLPQVSILDPTQSPLQETLQALKILKIRKQKMNKHKWKKRRRDVRNSSRYNKNKRGGDVRKKQE